MKRIIKLFACVGLVSLLLSSSLFALFPRVAAALTDYNYSSGDNKTIHGPNGNFNYSGSGGVYTGFQGCGTDRIQTSNHQAGGNSATLTDGCSGASQSITISAFKSYSGTFTNHSTIKVGNDLYVDDHIDDSLHFHLTNGNSNCQNQGVIEDFHHGGNDDRNVGSNVATIKLFAVPGGGNSNCIETDYPISLSQVSIGGTPAYDVYFLWADAGTIITSDGSGVFFIQNAGKGDYFGTGGRSGDSKCSSSIATSISNSVGSTHGDITLRKQSGNDPSLYEGWPNFISGANYKASQGCDVAGAHGITIGDPQNAKKAAGSSGKTNNTNETNGGSCESIGGVLSWILCPVIELLDSATNALDNAIQAQLTTPSIDNNGQLKEAWGRLRNIALIVLVPIMLIMVIGTAIGFQGLDAYTVKRAMPRLLIAVVFISLSWYIAAVLINLTNAVGAGVYGLITNPFGLASKSLGDMISVGSGGPLLTGMVIFGGFLAVTQFGVGIAVVLSLALVAGAALFLGFCVLVLRNVFIYALVLLAPLAILAWIFPNNDGLWKLWWGTFSKLLMMFPMIMALIAAGKIFASIIPIQQGGGGGFFTNAAIVIAYISPYFFIPATFKFAGGVFANLAGIINDRGRGLFDRQKEFRQKSRGENMQRQAAGKRFRGGNKENFRGRLNTGLQLQSFIGTGKAGYNVFNPGKLKRSALSQIGGVERAEISEMLEKDPEMQVIKGNDTLMGYANMSNNADQLRQQLILSGEYVGRESEMEQDIQRVENVRRKMGDAAFKQATFLQATSGGTFYGRQHKYIDRNGNQVEGEINWIQQMRASAENDSDLAFLAATGKGNAMGAGRADDGAASFGSIFEAARATDSHATKAQADALSELGITIGTEEVNGEQVYNRLTAEQAGMLVHYDALKNAGPGVMLHSSMKPDVMEQFAPLLIKRLETARRRTDPGAERAVAQEAAVLAGVLDAMGSSNIRSAQMTADRVMGIGMLNPDGSSSQQSVRQFIEGMRGDQQFNEMRREYRDATTEAANRPPTPATPAGAPPGAQQPPGGNPVG